MIKLLYITNGITGSGGLERVLSIKASYLADQYNYEVHILTLNEKGKNPFYQFSSKIKMHSIEMGDTAVEYLWQFLTKLIKALKTIKPDLILVCDDGLKGFFLPFLIRKPCPMIYERHASINLNLIKKRKRFGSRVKTLVIPKLMNWGAKSYDAIVLLTEGNLKEWRTGNERVIANPLSFYPGKTSLLTEKKVIAVGSHSYNKGYDLLLQAWEIIIIKHPDWRLEIYGKIDEDRTFVTMAEQLQLSNTVTFFQPITDIQEKFMSSSIMVLPSRSEGFGMVLIEAMACGVPCVSFDCPHGPGNIITDGLDGFLIKNGDVQALAEKIIFLIEHQEVLREMGKSAYVTIKKYLPENIISQWDELFQKLVEAN